jgi:hypothetical protein
MNIIQACILILGGAAIWMVGRRDLRVRRWGYVVGLISQPFWIYAAYQAGQWGVATLSMFYCYAWLDGIIEHWREKP